MENARQVVVLVTHALDDVQRATLGFVIATTAQSYGVPVKVFLSVEGVWLGVPGYADQIHVPNQPPLKELIQTFQEGGGQIFACTPCLKTRNIAPDQLLPGIVPAGAPSLVAAVLEPGTAFFQY